MGYKVKRRLTWVRKPNIPAEYQEVEYIQSTYQGNQRISTGYTANSNMRFVVEFSAEGTQQGTEDVIYGNTNTVWNWNGPLCFLGNAGVSFNYGAQNGWEYGNIVRNEKHTFDFNCSRAIIDGDTITRSTGPGSGELTLFYGNGRGGKAMIYSFKIYTGETLERDFIPCYRKSDNVIGMYDKVGGQFYTNSGTGTFIKGNDVTPTYDLKEKQIYPVDKKISCDFTQSDCGFIYYGNVGGGSPSYGRDGNGLYFYPSSSGYSAASWSVPSNIYSQGTLKKVEMVLYSQYANNGGGISVGVDTKVARTWINVLETSNRGASSSIVTTNPANTPYTLTIDLENAQMYCSTNANVLSLSSAAISGIQSDWTNGNVTICAMHGNTSYRGYAYIQKATFYF